MPHDVVTPFERDVLDHGGYQYSKTTRRSSLYAYKHFYDVVMTVGCLDGRRVLDLGCGDGTYTARMKDETRALSILGLDPAEAAIESARETYARSRPGLEFRCARARDLVQEGARFDIVVFGLVLHHVADPAREIVDGFRLADTILIIEPNGWSPVLKFNERFSKYHREHQERSYRMSQYRRWITDAGGSVSQGFYFGLMPVFCPDWMVTVCSTLEPWVEKTPAFRVIACGQICLLAHKRPADEPLVAR